VSSTDTQIVLALERSVGDGGTPITGYELEVDQGTSADSLLEAVTSTFEAIADYDYSDHGLSYTVDASALGLTSGKLYRFRFRALNYMGASTYSDTSRFGLGALPPAVPSGPARRADDAEALEPWNTNISIGLEWGAITGGALPVLEYVLYVDDGLEATPREAYRGPLAKAGIGRLTPGVAYTFYVTAVNYNGEGAPSPLVSLRSCVPPAGVVAPALVRSTEVAVTLRWVQPLDSGGCEITGYKLYHDDGAEGPITTAVAFVADPLQEIAEPYQFE